MLRENCREFILIAFNLADFVSLRLINCKFHVISKSGFARRSKQILISCSGNQSLVWFFTGCFTHCFFPCILSGQMILAVHGGKDISFANFKFFFFFFWLKQPNDLLLYEVWISVLFTLFYRLFTDIAVKVCFSVEFTQLLFFLLLILFIFLYICH